MKKFGFGCVLFATFAMAQNPAQLVLPADPAHLASIEGAIFGRAHQPLSGAKVSLRGLPISEAIADRFGRFSFQGLAPGEYTLTASDDGYVYQALSATVNLASGQHVSGIAITMLPLAILSGKVTDENGDPLPGVKVLSVQRDRVLNGRLRIGGASGSDAETDAKGEYKITVEPGRWYLRFTPVRTAGQDVAHITTFYPGVRDSASAAGLNVIAGQLMPELNVRLRKTAVYHVSGKVAGAVTKKMRIGAFQEAEGSADDNEQGQLVQDDGTFDIEGLAPGAWDLLVAPVPEPGTFDLAFPIGHATVEIVNRDVENVIVEALPDVDLIGSLKIVPEQKAMNWPDDGYKAEARLEPLFFADFTGGAAVRSDGTFTLEKTTAGRYRVELKPPPGGFVKSVMFGGKECIDSGIDVNGVPVPGGLQILVSMTAGQITGSVTNPDGTAPSVSTVTLAPDGPTAAVYRPELNLTVRTDSIGQFVVRNVVPGTYRVYAWERLEPISESGPLNETIAFTDPEFPRRFDDMSAIVTVGESESKRVSLSLISVAKMEVESRR